MQPKPHTRDVCCDESTHSTYLTYLHAFLLRFVVVGCQPFAECSLPGHFPFPFLVMCWQLCWPQCDDKQVKYDQVGGTASDAFHQFRSTISYIEVAMFDSAFQVSVQKIRCCVGLWVHGTSSNPCFVAREDPSVHIWGFEFHVGTPELDLSPSLIECHTHIWCEGMFAQIWFFWESISMGSRLLVMWQLRHHVYTLSNIRSFDPVNLPSFQLPTNSSTQTSRVILVRVGVRVLSSCSKRRKVSVQRTRCLERGLIYRFVPPSVQRWAFVRFWVTYPHCRLS